MGISETFAAVCSRNMSKSWLVGLLGCCMAILYPGTVMVIASGTKKQASLIVNEKIGRELRQFPNLDREIAKIGKSNDDSYVEFHNGSKVLVVASTDLSRGYRATINVYEEFRLMDKEIIDTVLAPFLQGRQPPFKKLAKYANYQNELHEEPKQIYITSAYYKTSWWWDSLRQLVPMAYKDRTVNFIMLDYLTLIKYGIKSAKFIANQKSIMDSVTFQQEYENIPFGENDNAYYKLKDFTQNQTISKAFYPQRKDSYRKDLNPYDLKSREGEIRIISVDIAARSGRENDNSVVACMRLLPTKRDGYIREVCYIESWNGENTLLQAKRIKQIFHDFRGLHSA